MHFLIVVLSLGSLFEQRLVGYLLARLSDMLADVRFVVLSCVSVVIALDDFNLLLSTELV